MLIFQNMCNVLMARWCFVNKCLLNACWLASLGKAHKICRWTAMHTSWLSLALPYCISMCMYVKYIDKCHCIAWWCLANGGETNTLWFEFFCLTHREAVRSLCHTYIRATPNISQATKFYDITQFSNQFQRNVESGTMTTTTTTTKTA